MWDDDRFVAMSDQAKLLWLYLITGFTGGVPGLIVGGIGSYSDAMRWDGPTTEKAIAELMSHSFVEYDRAKRLMRVPGGPKYAICTNQNVVKGWLRRWSDFPESPLKYRHIDSIREALISRAWFEASWAETFGMIKIPESSRQIPLFHYEAVSTITTNQPLSKESNDSGNIDTNEKEYSECSPRLNLNHSPLTVNRNPLTVNHKPVRPDAYAAMADQIWQEQEDACADLRARCGLDGRALGLVNPAKLELIRRISERTEAGTLDSAAEDCRHVLAVLLTEAQAKKTTRWLDGAHWESRRFNMALTRKIGGEPGSGRRSSLSVEEISALAVAAGPKR